MISLLRAMRAGLDAHHVLRAIAVHGQRRWKRGFRSLRRSARRVLLGRKNTIYKRFRETSLFIGRAFEGPRIKDDTGFAML
jgi:hypothetical protein